MWLESFKWVSGLQVWGTGTEIYVGNHETIIHRLLGKGHGEHGGLSWLVNLTLLSYVP